jgi:hypothetical protein
MRDPDEVVANAKLKATRVRYAEAVVRWRTAREQAERNLQAAEHELAQSLAELFRTPESVRRAGVGR